MRSYWQLFVTVLLFGITSALSIQESFAQPADARTWKSRDGREVTAEFLDLVDGKVHIRRTSDQKVFQVPLASLSDVDQAYVKSHTQFETPLGYLKELGRLKRSNVKTRVLAGLTIVDGKAEPRYEYGETNVRPTEVLVWVHFHTPEPRHEDIQFDKFLAMIDGHSYPVLATTTDLAAEHFEVTRKATTQHGTDQSTYLLFAIPQPAKALRLVYGEAGVDLRIPDGQPSQPTAAPSDKAAAKKQSVAEGLDYFIWSREKERVQSREGLLRMLIGIEYELNPAGTENQFSIVMSFTVKDTATGMTYAHQGISTQELKDYKNGVASAVLLGAESLTGEGVAVVYLADKADTKMPLSNQIEVPVIFAN